MPTNNSISNKRCSLTILFASEVPRQTDTATMRDIREGLYENGQRSSNTLVGAEPTEVGKWELDQRRAALCNESSAPSSSTANALVNVRHELQKRLERLRCLRTDTARHERKKN